jgi:hypothetical protein
VCTDVDVQGFSAWIVRGLTAEGDWPLADLTGVADGGIPKALAEK